MPGSNSVSVPKFVVGLIVGLILGGGLMIYLFSGSDAGRQALPSVVEEGPVP